jgi:hypothetical protein
MEPMIRFWWLTSVALFLVMLIYGLDQFRGFWGERQLIAHGTLVKATITHIDPDFRFPGQSAPPESACDLQIDNQATPLTGVLLSGQEDNIYIGQRIQLRMDPNDPSIWTDRMEPEPIGHRLIAGTVILPILAGTLVTTWLLRRRVLAAWQNSEAREYAVVDSVHSALAPLSHTVRCEPIMGHDRRLVTVYLPGRFAKPAPGEILWLLYPPGHAKAAVAAVAYQ